ncbi:F0F1 ATP synthase subunit epsilon, partial [Acinetobacter courvalinii]
RHQAAQLLAHQKFDSATAAALASLAETAAQPVTIRKTPNRAL